MGPLPPGSLPRPPQPSGTACSPVSHSYYHCHWRGTSCGVPICIMVCVCFLVSSMGLFLPEAGAVSTPLSPPHSATGRTQSRLMLLLYGVTSCGRWGGVTLSLAEETSLQALFPASAESQRRQHQRERPQRRHGRPEPFTAAREGAEGKLGRLGGSYPWLLLTGTRAPSSTCAPQWRWWGAGGGYYGTVHADNVQGPAVAILGRVLATVSREELGQEMADSSISCC